MIFKKDSSSSKEEKFPAWKTILIIIAICLLVLLLATYLYKRYGLSSGPVKDKEPVNEAIENYNKLKEANNG